jgi:protein gp37
MAENSKIEWTGATWNPFIGCEKVSAGCKFCYAERLVEGRFKRKFRDVQPTKNPTFYFPLRYAKTFDGTEPFTERLVFTCSLSDFFIAQADVVRWQLWQIIRQTPNLIYQILTKRPERILDNLPPDWGDGYPNVWLGTSAENQETFDERVPILNQVPAKVRFVSVEPILAPVTITRPVDWVIVGGESGGLNKYRPAKLSWIYNLVEHCIYNGTPVFVKQLGTDLAKTLQLKDWKGGDISEFPEAIRVRQWPRGYSIENAGV